MYNADMSVRLSLLSLCLFVLVSCGGHRPAPYVHYGQSSGAGSAGVHTVTRGDTLSTISRNYRLPLRDIAFLNGIKKPYRLAVGQRLKLPPPREYTVQRGDSISDISLLFNVNGGEVIQLNRLQSPYVLRVGQVLRLPSTIPEEKPKSVRLAQPNSPVAKESLPQSKPKPVVETKVQDGVPMPGTKPRAVTTISKVTTQAPKRASSKFLKPVPGRVVSGFGSKKSGLRNDGINISAARGTSVKAAENGVVVYAGNALKGSGNLILVRHANNWMTAYAHLDRINVTKGQTVSRGSVIGKVGSTGSVSEPQLHFEVRKGTSAVNPIEYME